MTDIPYTTSFPLSSPFKYGKVNNAVVWTIGKVLLIVILIVGAYFIGTKNPTSQATLQTMLTKPSYTKTINKDFSFPVKDDKGNTITTLTYTISSLDLQNEIIVQGQKADSVSGRTFLILNLKLQNPSNQNIQINTRDFIRMGVDNRQDLLAPEIHNDPVTIQPISTKYARLALPVDASIKDVKLYVGEINGPKTIVDIPIKK